MCQSLIGLVLGVGGGEKGGGHSAPACTSNFPGYAFLRSPITGRPLPAPGANPSGHIKAGKPSSHGPVNRQPCQRGQSGARGGHGPDRRCCVHTRRGGDAEPAWDALQPEVPALQVAGDGPSTRRSLPGLPRDPSFQPTDAGPITQHAAGAGLGHGAVRIAVASISHASSRSVHTTTLGRPLRRLAQPTSRAPEPRASACSACSVTAAPVQTRTDAGAFGADRAGSARPGSLIEFPVETRPPATVSPAGGLFVRSAGW
jgi:hypothetical protein